MLVILVILEVREMLVQVLVLEVLQILDLNILCQSHLQQVIQSPLGLVDLSPYLGTPNNK